VAQTQGKIAETELQIIQVDEDSRAAVMKEMREIQAKAAELSERRIAADDQLKRVEIRAPSSGYVHQLAVHTVGGVISAAEPVMLIVPEHESLNLEARVMPQDIDQLTAGQHATVRVHASNQRTTPELTGTLSRISADVTKESQTGVSYYTIRVALPGSEIHRLGGVRLQAGMQAEVFVQTHARTPLQYFLKPLQDQITRAFREI
jgi:HlyD family secretion protein